MAKHVSFANQREQCRLNKYTYTEKCSCGIVTLMCNYPFADPKHKKGICRANTCTDMRKQMADDIKAIAGVEASVIKEDIAQLASKEPKNINPSQDGHLESYTPEEAEAAQKQAEAAKDAVATPKKLSGVDGAYDEIDTVEPDPKGSVRAE